MIDEILRGRQNETVGKGAPRRQRRHFRDVPFQELLQGGGSWLDRDRLKLNQCAY